MGGKAVFSLFMFFASVFAATTSVNNANYQASDGTWHFDTDMQFTTDFTLTANPGDVASGNPNNLQDGDAVCQGATVTVDPDVTARWATPDFFGVSIYPTCGGGFCPAMINYGGGVSSNRNIRWMAGATWDNHKTFGDANDFSQDPARHDQLLSAGGFDNQPVTYNNASGQFHANKEGGASVFCKGTLQVLDGATVKGSSSMPTVNNVNFVVNTAGAHQIKTQLSNVNCFAVIEKHPTNKNDNPSWFYFYYFTHNAPAIPATSGLETVNLNVQSGGGTCNMHETQVNLSGSLTDEDNILVKVRMHNDGDAIRVTGVSSSNADYSASEFPVGLCAALGFPPSLCPASNGFNSDIAPGADKDLYVYLERSPGASGGTTLTFTAQTVSTACGGATMCNEDVPLPDGVPAFCEITPNPFSVETNEVANYEVDCWDIDLDPVACVGSNWFWADGLVGDFIEKTNDHAHAYTSSPPGSSGTLRYQSGGVIAPECQSDIDVIEPTYECEFIPPSANMPVSTTQHFDFQCFVDGLPEDPDDAEYDLINGLGGSTSNEAIDGVDYNAPGVPDFGDLRGFGKFNDAPDPILGAVAIAPINVFNGSGNNTSCPNPNGCGPGGAGSTQWCTIGSGPFSPFPGYYGWLQIKCGEFANETCSSVSWSITPGTGSLSGSNNQGTYVNITGDAGDSGEITAVIDEDGHGCSKPFTIANPACWELS